MTITYRPNWHGCGRTCRPDSAAWWRHATLSYLCSETYNPTGEHSVHPLDPDLGIEWPADTALLSARDEAAPSLADAIATGLLPDYAACKEFTESLRAG